MQDKLQELTDKLYNEGLSKGKKEAEDLLAKAGREADNIIAQANEKAAQIIAKAEKDAGEMKSRVENDIRMASTQSISATRQQIENLISAKAVGSNVGKAFSDTAFVKELIGSVVKSFNAANPESVALEAILPADKNKEMQDAFANEVLAILGKGAEVKFSKGLANGFKIGPKDGGYKLSFTEEDFTNLIGGYLRPATRKILFGE